MHDIVRLFNANPAAWEFDKTSGIYNGELDPDKSLNRDLPTITVYGLDRGEGAYLHVQFKRTSDRMWFDQFTELDLSIEEKIEIYRAFVPHHAAAKEIIDLREARLKEIFDRKEAANLVKVTALLRTLVEQEEANADAR